MRTAGGLDSTFLALETDGHPLHVMAVMMLDPATVPGGYSFAGLREFVADRLPGIPPFRQKLVSVPMGVGRPRWVDVDVDVDEHFHRVIFDGGGLPELARIRRRPRARAPRPRHSAVEHARGRGTRRRCHRGGRESASRPDGRGRGNAVHGEHVLAHTDTGAGRARR